MVTDISEAIAIKRQFASEFKVSASLELTDKGYILLADTKIQSYKGMPVCQKK